MRSCLQAVFTGTRMIMILDIEPNEEHATERRRGVGASPCRVGLVESESLSLSMHSFPLLFRSLLSAVFERKAWESPAFIGVPVSNG